MTVSTSISRVDYTGNGATTHFSVPFPFIDEDYLTVIRTVIATGVETVLALNSTGADGYTVSGAGASSGSVTVVTSPTSLQRLSIIRSVPATQETSFTPNDTLPAESLEDALDKLTMVVGDISTGIDRSMQLPSGATGVSVQLPTPVAYGLLGWNSAATALVNYTSVDLSGTLVSVFMDGFLELTDAESARTHIGAVGAADLGPLATVTPTGTADNTTFLRGNNTYSNELGGRRVGFMDVAYATQNSNYGFTLTDRGSGVIKDSTATPTWTIPANASVAFPVGTVISLANVGASGNVSLAITSDTLQLAGSTTTGTRTLAPGFIGGIVKVASTRWFVFGAGAT